MLLGTVNNSFKNDKCHHGWLGLERKSLNNSSSSSSSGSSSSSRGLLHLKNSNIHWRDHYNRPFSCSTLPVKIFNTSKIIHPFYPLSLSLSLFLSSSQLHYLFSYLFQDFPKEKKSKIITNPENSSQFNK